MSKIWDVREARRQARFASAVTPVLDQRPAHPMGSALLQVLGVAGLLLGSMALLTLGMAVHSNPLIGFVAVAAVAWGTSELARHRDARILEAAGAFAWLMGMAGTYFYAVSVAFLPIDADFGRMQPKDIPPIISICCAASMVLVSLAHWGRFRVPAVVAPAVFGVATCFGAIALWFVPTNHLLIVAVIQTLLGLVALAAGFAADATDVYRQKAGHRLAFWLHVVAAVYLPQGVIALLTLQPTSDGMTLLALGAVIMLTSTAGLLADRQVHIPGAAQAVAGLVLVFAPGDRAILATALTFYAVLMLLGWSAARPLLVASLPPAWRANLPRDPAARREAAKRGDAPRFWDQV